MTIFLDRDGVINRKRPEGDYVKSVSEFEFLEGAVEALVRLTRAGHRLIVVTNQRGIARGLMTEAHLSSIHQHMLSRLAEQGARIAAIYHCPHEAGDCDCRKPRTGLFYRAQADFPDIDFTHAVVVGDSLSDRQAAETLGCRFVRIGGAGPGEGERWPVAPSLLDAVPRILEAEPPLTSRSP